MLTVHHAVQVASSWLPFVVRLQTQTDAKKTGDVMSKDIHPDRIGSAVTARQDFEKAQLRVSAMAPHHRVMVSYAVMPPNMPTPAIFTLLDIQNASNRFAPRQLIPSKTIQVNSGRDESTTDQPYYLVPDAREMLSEVSRDILSQEQGDGTIFQLINSMNSSAAFVGTTHLLVRTVTIQHHSGIHIAVLKVSEFARAHGQKPMKVSKSYMFPLTAFEQLRDDAWQPPWWHLVSDTIYRRTDSAARFVARQLDAFDVDDDRAGAFKSFEPFLSFDFAMQPAKTPAVGAADCDVDCAICREEAAEAVVPLICKFHRYHRECLTEWFQSRGPEKADCPVCRRKCIDESVARSMTFGLTDGEYHPDPRFDAYENWERSCADLDERVASNIGETFEVNKELLMEAWAKVIAGARLESSSSRPPSQQLADAPEMPTIEHGLVRGIDIIQRYTADHPDWCTFSLAAKHIYHEILRVLKETAEASDSLKYVWVNNGQCWCASVSKYLRPGQEVFLKTSISRMLMMARVRRCTKHTGWHFHGGREYRGDVPRPSAVQEGRHTEADDFSEDEDEL